MIVNRIQPVLSACSHKVIVAHHSLWAKWEHVGFVVYAGCETFEFHNVIYYASVMLLICGAFAVGYDIFYAKELKHV